MLHQHPREEFTTRKGERFSCRTCTDSNPYSMKKRWREKELDAKNRSEQTDQRGEKTEGAVQPLDIWERVLAKGTYHRGKKVAGQTEKRFNPARTSLPGIILKREGTQGRLRIG